MPDGTTPPGDPDQQIDASVSVAEAGRKAAEAYEHLRRWLDGSGIHLPAPGTPYTTGGGGGGGQFQVHSVAELDALIQRWTDLRTQVEASGRRISAAMEALEPPARDEVSKQFTKAVAGNLALAHQHNSDMLRYTDEYVAKLKQARDAYAGTDSGNAAALQGRTG
ncbi:PE domain-containing protein [Actinokineospora bangkokensis]|uniref:PE domain-containing protein n=1 Tax=Actinokineospora bangkokensis TaxID=1193682 RepID=A0A1Q9LCN4_9PSEU|nr:PE domain-containing protein [Actinokineospora bangkokensis]OLR89790.1 hypothetical protein BJP25_01830 [Actinokineospora bangkokensis]